VRLSNGFSRELETHEAAVALNYFVYNFIRIHRTLRVTPAMAAGVTSKLWEVSDLVVLLEEAVQKSSMSEHACAQCGGAGYIFNEPPTRKKEGG
jgi:hypothetical protein